MQVRLIALAALACAGSAHALTLAEIDAARNNSSLKEIVIFGASAQSPMVAAYMKELCAGNDYHEYWNDAAGKNHRAYSCKLPVAVGTYPAQTPVLVIKRDAGGSIYGVNHVSEGLAAQSMVVSSAACTAGPGTPAGYCGTTAAVVPHAGISDVEPAQFGKTVTVNGASVVLNQPNGVDDTGNTWTVPTSAQLAALDVASMGQTLYGVAVTKDLRNALQTAQGLATGQDDVANMPSLGRAFVSGALSGFVRGGVAGYPSWASVTGNAADSSKTVKICRRTDGSGTQVVSNLHFLNAGILINTSLGMLAPIGSKFLTPVGTTVVEGAGTGDVETCLNTVDGTFALGVISREKDPLINGKNYRYVKLDGQAPLRDLARVGQYPLVYTSSMQWKKSGGPDAGAIAFLKAMRTTAVTPARIDGYVSAEAKGGLLASPNRWDKPADLCEAATDAQDKLFGSCVERVDFSDGTYNPAVRLYGTVAYKTTSNAVLHQVK